MANTKLKVALLCGGPSLERGISLNSARSVCDHLQSDEIEVLPIYFDQFRNVYQISKSQLYSNTPSDFDFKLKKTAKPLSKFEFSKFLKTVDLAFPAMHGAFGEDGQIQAMLEENGCAYTGSNVEACKKAFDKYTANEYIRKYGFYTLPSTVLEKNLDNHKEILDSFFDEHKIKRAIVKPATGGSSIGVYSVSTVDEALEKANKLFEKEIDSRVVIEPFCEGIEFTVITLENRFSMPVAILPTEIEMSYENHHVFDYRKKYLATNHVNYHCPPRFSDEIIEKIQIQAEQLFKVLGMNDFARFDGWLLPDGNIWFSDFNPISGMEQNSFLFLQATQLGMSHRDVVRFIVKSACRRYGIAFPEKSDVKKNAAKDKMEVNVLFGGKTAERQVSVMSGTNVWLKLRNSEKYNPKPYLLDLKHNVWRLPYSFTLNHTVEEIQEMCENAPKNEQRIHDLKRRVLEKLALLEGETTEELFLPEKISLEDFIDRSGFVFVGLHGGIGEDGTFQKMLEQANTPFTASGSTASRLCMDKHETGKLIAELESEGIYTAPKKLITVETFKNFETKDYENYWLSLIKDLNGESLIVKPHGDGCSAGIARLFSFTDLEKYLEYVIAGAMQIPNGTLEDQHGIIEMPNEPMEKVLFEQFIITDSIRVIGNDLEWKNNSKWIEATIGVIEENGKMKAMNPSITVASGNVLTLEEKFQGGTGVNITPPPTDYVKEIAIKNAKLRMEKVAEVLGIRGYARIDVFMHIETGELIIIEANSTPGLTPSTVIYHQALEENPSLYPTEFLEKICENAFRKSS